MPLTKIQSLGITDGTIVNADINASAAIAGTKLSGAGKVLQVVTATDDTTRTTTSATFVTASNTLSVTITPSSASNKILILVSSPIQVPDNAGYFTIYRGATNLGTSNGMGAAYGAGTGTYDNLGINYLDSPSTTSATTYQVYIKTAGGVTASLNLNSTRGSITCLEIAA